MYVLRYDGKYVKDFGYPKPELTDDIDKAAYWCFKKDVRENFKENGFSFNNKYEFVKCGLRELTEKQG
jgi:hypothetical protein